MMAERASCWLIRRSCGRCSATCLILKSVGRRTPGRWVNSWRVDETYIKVKGQWVYLYRAVDKAGRTVDFLLSRRRDMAAAKRFFSRATKQHGAPRVITLDGYAASHPAVAKLENLRNLTAARTGAILQIPEQTDRSSPVKAANRKPGSNDSRAAAVRIWGIPVS